MDQQISRVGLPPQHSEQHSQAGIDNRRAHRTNVEQAATIIVSDNGNQKVMPCTILNISRTGALLKLDEAKLPGFFTLQVSGFDFNHKAARVWTKGHLAGICFIQELASTPEFATDAYNELPLEETSTDAHPSSVDEPGTLVRQQSFPLKMPAKKPTKGFGKRR